MNIRVRGFHLVFLEKVLWRSVGKYFQEVLERLLYGSGVEKWCGRMLWRSVVEVLSRSVVEKCWAGSSVGECCRKVSGTVM